MKTIWCFILLCVWCYADVSHATEISCSEEYHYCTLTKITQKDSNQEIDLVTVHNKESIQLVELYNETLERIPVNLFTEFPQLNEINVKATLGVIPKDTFPPANSLTNADFSSCNITDIEDFAFSNGNNLTDLVLDHNGITVLRHNTLAGLPQLERLSIDHNQISRIEDGALNLPLLTRLSLTNNQLTTLSDDAFSLLPNLNSIYLGWNKLEEIGRSLYSLQKVSTIYLNDNKIRDIDLMEFAKLPLLSSLGIANSGFNPATQTDISDATVIDSNLSVLEISDNIITNPNSLNALKLFKNLYALDLIESSLEEINLDVSSVRELFPGLEIINIKHSKRACDHLKKLKELFAEKKIKFFYFTYDCTN